ncbi:MAG TPA: nucleotidyltransferase family protein [Candidatus Kapabacteria bacterium]
MQTKLPIHISDKAIADFCDKNYITKLSFFGSVVRNDFRPDSDVDVLVEFDKDHIPGLAFFRMQKEFEQILGREVDMLTTDSIKPHLRDNILASAIEYYVQA